MNCQIVPVGDQALMVKLAPRVEVKAARRIHAVCGHLAAAGLPGVVELVPAATTVTLFYSVPQLIAAGGPEDGDLAQWLTTRVRECLATLSVLPELSVHLRVIEIPVCYGGKFGPDLEEVAQRVNLSAAEVIALHCAAEYSVLQLGFAPGFPYLAGLPEALAIPRRETPRLAVPAGSIGIANDQSCIYPVIIPGGWNLIGCTPCRLFRPGEEPPVLLQPGDQVKFRPISASAFAALETR